MGSRCEVLLLGGADINTALTLDSGAPGETVNIAISPNPTLRLSGAIGGPSGLAKAGGGALYSRWRLREHVRRRREGRGRYAAGWRKTAAVPSGLVVDGGTGAKPAPNAIAGAVTVNAPGTLDLGGYTDTISALNGDGAVQLGHGMLIIAHPLLASSFQGVISGEGQVVKDGASLLLFRQELQTFTGGMTVNGGSLGIFNEGALTSDVILKGGRLHGAGPLGALTATGGRWPRASISRRPGVFEPKGMTLAAGVEAHFDLYWRRAARATIR